MTSADALFEAAVQAFRLELTAAVQAVHDARNPRAFTNAERELIRLSRQVADDMVQRSLQSVSDNPERVREAMDLVREKAATRGITLRSIGRRPTKVRLLGGSLVDLVTLYASARPCGGGSCKQRGAQGSGVYPVLDQCSSSAIWVRNAFHGEALRPGLHVALELAPLRIVVRDGDTTYRLSPAANELRRVLTAAGLPDRPLELPTWDLPDGPYSDREGTAEPEALEELSRWYSAADALLQPFAQRHGSAVRCWPHHFDIATLIVRRDAAEPEERETVGIGMTPGDGGIPDPYLYVTPWPYPEERPTPPLPAGRWNTRGWYGAVLEAGEVTSDAQARAFVEAAFEAVDPRPSQSASPGH